VVEVAPVTAVLQPATTGVGMVVVVVVDVVVVASVALGGAEAFVLSVVTAMTPVTANRAVVNFFADMTCSLNEVIQVVTIGNCNSKYGESQGCAIHQ
jgi:hypothetical protein